MTHDRLLDVIRISLDDEADTAGIVIIMVIAVIAVSFSCLVLYFAMG
jgi:hypothetical protein